MSENLLKLENIKKNFGSTEVLNGINLYVDKGEFITLLGSSGCGKTTTIRIIAGLEMPDEGKVFLNGKEVTYLDASKRDVNTVFQNYALFPHMTVAQNIAYGLKIKKLPKKEIQKKVVKILDLVMLSGFENRMPSEMSGGQKQRVAIARAIINSPEILLLDEPLGALDLQLRRQMQVELKRLQKKLGITFIYITHDQEEAINMSDRIAVMKNGLFEQIGTPQEIYDSPKTSYVAKFVGNANIIEGKVHNIKGHIATILSAGRKFDIRIDDVLVKEGQKITIAIRSENVEISKEDNKRGLEATIIEKNFSGGQLCITSQLKNGEQITASRHGIDSSLQLEDTVFLSWIPEHGIPVDCKTKEE